jgi:murein DD-endopeptidase MepM/ murein hydrolase activator NlpD
MNRFFYPANYLLLIISTAISAWSQPQSGGVTLSFEPKEAYIEKRGTDQIVNFDLLLQNGGSRPLRINKIQVSVYDSTGSLAFRRYLDENGRPSGISTVPDRLVPAGGVLDVFNPFYSFGEEMPLSRLHYEIFFEKSDEKEPNLLNFIAKSEGDVYPKPYTNKTELILPLKGRIYVFDGHDFYAHHRRQTVFRNNEFRQNSVRYGYDLMIANATGELYRGDRFVPENWFSYGSPVYAPAAGIIADAVDNVPDNSYKDGEVVYPPLPEGVDPLGMGNHVVIDHFDGEFSIMVHMKPGSVRVKRGDKVRQGEQIGAIGFSGDTFLPHLHYQVMDGPDERTNICLPSYFNDFKRILGLRVMAVRRGQIDSGDLVESSSTK